MPLDNWIAIHDENDYSQVLKSGNATPEECYERYTELSDECMRKHGTSKNFKLYVRISKKLRKLYIKYILTGDRTIKNEINIRELELEELRNKDVKMPLEQYKTHVEMTAKFEFKTVDAFYYGVKKLADESN